jgi:hypothetical protein
MKTELSRGRLIPEVKLCETSTKLRGIGPVVTCINKLEDYEAGGSARLESRSLPRLTVIKVEDLTAASRSNKA